MRVRLEMFGKLMSISDELMARYYEVLLREELPAGIHPMEAKKSLARRIVARFHSAEEAATALGDFEKRFSRRDLEHSDLPVFSPSGDARDLVSLVVEAYARCFSISKSRSEARRLVEGGSIQWGGEKSSRPKGHLARRFWRHPQARQDPRGAPCRADAGLLELSPQISTARRSPGTSPASGSP